MISRQLRQRLKSHDKREQLISHPFLKHMKQASSSRSDVEIILGQWWHPLHYFPDFLSRAIAASDQLVAKTALARILDEELGEGETARAHEQIYVDTMRDVGFAPDAITKAAPLAATRALLDGYRRSTDTFTGAIGFAYGTEVADLAMVSSIGCAVRSATGAGALPWVDIHVQQEPHHVARVDEATALTFDAAEEAEIVQSAETMWMLWTAFFHELDEATRAPARSRAS